MVYVICILSAQPPLRACLACTVLSALIILTTCTSRVYTIQPSHNMSIGSPSAGEANNLVFWAGHDVEGRVVDDDPPEPGLVADLLGDLQTLGEKRLSQNGKPESMYVTLFHGEFR